MNSLIIQILAMGITVTQLFSKPVEKFQVHFDSKSGAIEAEKILREGCKIIGTQIKDPRFNLELILSALVTDSEADNSNSSVGKNKSNSLFRKIDFGGLLTAYRFFCKNEQSLKSQIDLNQVISYYNATFTNLKSVESLKSFKYAEANTVLDSRGKHFTEIYGAGNRRIFVPIAKIPNHVKQAFVSAEDRSFYKHHGIDLMGLFRAFTSLTGGASGRPQGGSTITQQVVKNLLLNDDLTVERKMRELLLAARLERIMSKDQILELYLNYIFFGRSSWGIEMAAKSYFGADASVTKLTAEQAATLALLVKGPMYYNPDRQPERARARRQYVLNRMREDCIADKKPNCISAQQISDIAQKPIKTVSFESPTVKGGFYFQDAIIKEAKNSLGFDLRTEPKQVVRATINTDIQRATDQSIREGLVEYESRTGRQILFEVDQRTGERKLTVKQGSIAHEVEKLKMQWQDALPRAIARHYDIPWTLAVILDTKKPQVGLANGKILPLHASGTLLQRLRVYDLIFVDVEIKNKSESARIKIPAQVQGAAVVLENKTGKVLAITGGFSYAMSDYNRALNALRQPGSTLKPFVYLAALNAGYQPNTLIPNEPVPNLFAKWNPQNYDRSSGGLVTLRTAVEKSLNLPTVQLTARLGGDNPFDGLSYVQSIFKDMSIYKEDKQRRDFSEVLGSREVRLIDLAVAYATIANGGFKPKPYFIESINRDGRSIYNRKATSLEKVQNIDAVSFYQLRRILEGTISRGTAVRLKSHEGYIAGKTGTSNNERDAWFVVFTNDITVAVWAGYDKTKPFVSLGGGSTGGAVALPIAEKILASVFRILGQPGKLAKASPEVQSQIIELPIDLATGSFAGNNFIETFRRDDKTRDKLDTIQALLRPGEAEYLIKPTSEITDEESTTDEESSSEADRYVAPVPNAEIVIEPQPQSPENNYRPGIEEEIYENWRKNQQRKVDETLQQYLDYINNSKR